VTYPPAGWYPDETTPGTERFWNGSRWMEASRETIPIGPARPLLPEGPPIGPRSGRHSALMEPARAPQSNQTARLVISGALILAVIGIVIEAQPVSLATGGGTLYTGLALAAGAVALAFIMKARLWLRILTAVVVLLCIANCVSTQHDLNNRRDQLRQDLQQIGNLGS
jgi:hypothetical protein